MECDAEIAPGLLSCPGCRRLVHSEELKSLAVEAEAAERTGDLTRALGAWRRALDILPPDSRQHEAVLGRINALSSRVDTAPPPAPSSEKPRWTKGLAGAGALALLAWKSKAVLVFLLTKGKLLLAGLTKASTFLSMALAFGVYWTAWGWKFALGLVLSIYVHEMGHVAMLRRYGIRATAPMFIPGLGAIVRLKQYPVNPREDARVGLAGPMWGLGASVVAYGVYLATGWGNWGAIAKIGAWINLFNLLPLWQLDGGRGFRSLTRSRRWVAAAAIGAMWFLSAEGLLLLLLLAAVFRAFERNTPAEPDRLGLFQYVFLILALSGLCMVQVTVPGIP
jgi:Zn-dependent protease